MPRTRKDVSETRTAAVTEAELQQYADDFAKRYQAINALYLRKIGQHLRDIGELTPSDVHMLEQMQRMTRNLSAIKKEIAKAANMSVSDIDTIFNETAQKNAIFAEKVYNLKENIKVSENKPLVALINAARKETADAMRNLSNTTVVDKYYRDAVDTAVQAVQTGKESYQKAIERAIRTAGQNGLKVEYESGAKRRLDSAARMNVLDGVRHLNQNIMNELGDQFGADGVEIDAHALCADDHLPYQGKQFTDEEFQKIQDGLERPFGEWNCRHSWHRIIMGISKPAFTDEQLQEFRDNSNETIEIEGKTKTRYEWSQEMRKLETRVREEKEGQYASKQAGASTKDSASAIAGLLDRYKTICDKTGLEPEYKRTSIYAYNGLAQQQQKTPKASAKAVSVNPYQNPIPAKETHYKELLDGLQTRGVKYNPITMMQAKRSESDIIDALAGGDMTNGSCASLGLAYIAQKNGIDALDYRDGDSREFFSSSVNLYKLSKADGISTIRPTLKTALFSANELLKQCEVGKQYYLCVGRHAAIVQKTKDGKYEYLELQSRYQNGWREFNTDPKKTLRSRFGCSTSFHSTFDFMICIDDSNFDTDEFKTLMGYINTDKKDQRKGSSGSVR